MTFLERAHFVDELRFDDYFWSLIEELNVLHCKFDDIMERPHYDTKSQLLFALNDEIRTLKVLVN